MTVCKSRVTVDIDGYVRNWELKAIRAYEYLRRHADSVSVRVSKSGTGVHIVGYYSERVDTDRIRERLSDDSKRVELDQTRRRHGLTTQVLWKDDPDFKSVYDAIDHIQKTRRTMADRFKTRVQRGTLR